MVTVGTVTQICVEETVREGFHRGFEKMVRDGVSLFDPELHAATLRNIEMKFGRVEASERLTAMEQAQWRLAAPPALPPPQRARPALPSSTGSTVQSGGWAWVVMALRGGARWYYLWKCAAATRQQAVEGLRRHHTGDREHAARGVESTQPQPGVRVYVKSSESYNPTGSVKDSVARSLIESAEEDGLIVRARRSWSHLGEHRHLSRDDLPRKGYPLKVVMPDNVTGERTELLRMYGAEIVYSPGEQGSNGAVAMALELAEADSCYYLPYQYGN